MSALFGKIFKQSLLTFDRKNVSAFNTNFNVLKQLVDQLNPRDLNMEVELMSEEAFRKEDKAPCTFVHIFENDSVSISVFILRGGYTMPLHDHPMMHGILKTLSGCLLVQSFTKTDSNGEIYSRFAREVITRAEQPKSLTTSSESAVLSPVHSNYHEISAVGGVAAFFDILSPPYNADIPLYGRRRCNFYQKIQNANSNNFLLQRIPSPESYYCDTGEYEPPEFVTECIIK